MPIDNMIHYKWVTGKEDDPTPVFLKHFQELSGCPNCIFVGVEYNYYPREILADLYVCKYGTWKFAMSRYDKTQAEDPYYQVQGGLDSAYPVVFEGSRRWALVLLSALADGRIKIRKCKKALAIINAQEGA